MNLHVNSHLPEEMNITNNKRTIEEKVVGLASVLVVVVVVVIVIPRRNRDDDAAYAGP